MKFSTREIRDVSHRQKEPLDRSALFSTFLGFPTTMIAAGANAVIQSQSQVPFRLRRLVIDSVVAGNIAVNGISVGNCCIFPNAHPAPGTAFPPLPRTIEDQETMKELEKILLLKADVLRISQLVTLSVTNKGVAPIWFQACFWGEILREE